MPKSGLSINNSTLRLASLATYEDKHVAVPTPKAPPLTARRADAPPPLELEAAAQTSRRHTPKNHRQESKPVATAPQAATTSAATAPQQLSPRRFSIFENLRLQVITSDLTNKLNNSGVKTLPSPKS